MKAVIAVVVVALAMLCSPAVKTTKAWNCPAGQVRVQAPAGTPTNTPYYDVVEGIAFICQDPSQSGTSNSNTNSNTNNNSSSSKSSSNSNSTAINSTTVKATGGNSTSTSTATGGTGIGIGGSATGGSVKDSGNSSNTNVNTATGGSVKDSGNSTAIAEGGQGGQGGKGGSAFQTQSQDQSQSTKSSANNNGNGNGDNSNNTYVPRQTATAVAPIVPATVPCFKGIGVGAQGPGFGASFGGGKIDPNCAALETARSFLAAGSREAYCRVMLTVKAAKEAGITMDMCMAPTVAVEPPAPIADTTPITINIPAPVILQSAPPVVTVIPAPATPPAVDVAQAAVANKAERQHAKKHTPCPTN